MKRNWLVWFEENGRVMFWRILYGTTEQEAKEYAWNMAAIGEQGFYSETW